jgi:phosphatidylethanolamine-binding protein (PEBP) family uncharacterized protein
MSLPKKVESKRTPADPAGSRQTNSYSPNRIGYLGPCPPTNEHVYEFAAYALNVDKLDQVDDTKAGSAVTAMKKAQIGVATLKVRYRKK